jgi:8-oxo-dGTP pyrophosphatase MutT (NUDIX family)
MGRMGLIRAAGGVVWRGSPAEPRVAVIHRPRRGDWTLPKGKLEQGEAWEEAALREVREETGCACRLAEFAASSWYVPNRTPKVVLYWNMALRREGDLDGDGDEVDEVRWLRLREALARLDYASERRVLLRAAARREARGVRRREDAVWKAVAAARARLVRRALRDGVDGESLGKGLARLDRAEDALAEARELVAAAERVAGL